MYIDVCVSPFDRRATGSIKANQNTHLNLLKLIGLLH